MQAFSSSFFTALRHASFQSGNHLRSIIPTTLGFNLNSASSYCGFHGGSFVTTRQFSGSASSHLFPAKAFGCHMNMNHSGGGSPLLGASVPILTTVRTKIRNYWPRPRETKRIRTHGLKKRLSTPGGRMIIMKRILKGRHVLAH